MSASVCARLVALLITPFTSVIYAGSNYGFLTRGIDTEMTYVNVSDMMGVHVDELAFLPNAVSPPPHMVTNSTFGWDPFIPNERDPFDTRLWNLSISTFDSNYQHVDCNISIYLCSFFISSVFDGGLSRRVPCWGRGPWGHGICNPGPRGHA